MMNKVILIGNLGKDPEIKYIQDGETAIAKFSLATSEKWKDKTTGEMQERTEWHRIAAFGRLAEICKDYLFKGKQVFIEGKIQTSSYEKDGITRFNTEIIASTMKMLGSRNSGGDNSQAKTPKTSSKASSEISEDPGESEPEPEKDDIPF
jgi:single-strand DNA-binding protein